VKKRKLYWDIAIVLLLAIGILIRISIQHGIETHAQTMVLKQEPVLPIPDLKPDKETISRVILALTTRLSSDRDKVEKRLMLLQSVRKQNLPENEILESLQLMADRYEVMYKNENNRFHYFSLQQLGIIHCFLGNSERGLKFLKESIARRGDRDYRQNYHLEFVYDLIQKYNLTDDAKALFLLLSNEAQNRHLYLKSYLLDATLPPLIGTKDSYLWYFVFFSQLKRIIQNGQLDLADHIAGKLQAEEYWRIFSTEMREYELEAYMELTLVLARLDYLRGRKNHFDEKQQKLESQLELWIKAENMRYDKARQNGPSFSPFERQYLELPLFLKLECLLITIDADQLEVSIQALKELKRPLGLLGGRSQSKYDSCFYAIRDVLIQRKDYVRIHELIEAIFQDDYDRLRQKIQVYDKLLTAGEKIDAELWANQSQIPQPYRNEIDITHTNIDITHAILQKDFEKANKEIDQLKEPETLINFLFGILNQ